MGTKIPVHPNDHVNMSQSTNDTFPTAINIAVESIHNQLIPALQELRTTNEKSIKFNSIVKLGRTHLQDEAIKLGQEFSGYVSAVDHDVKRVKSALPLLRALGGTAVGTGINSVEGFSSISGRNFTNNWFSVRNCR